MRDDPLFIHLDKFSQPVISAAAHPHETFFTFFTDIPCKESSLSSALEPGECRGQHILDTVQ